MGGVHNFDLTLVISSIPSINKDQLEPGEELNIAMIDRGGIIMRMTEGGVISHCNV